ncbi:MAG: amidase family protein [Oceanococcaceae bacterium]
MLVLNACGGGRPEELPASSRADSPPFELLEADMQAVHEALAGERLLEDGSTLNCTALVEMYIQRIFAYDKTPQPSGGLAIRGVLYINPHALEAAAELDALYARDGGIGERPLHCMPVLLKDNYDTYDHPSSSGSYAMLGHQAGIDAHSVVGLRAAGAVILGKANQDEFAFFTTGFSARAIQVMNPYNTSESPAGSSSGTGASIASNFALGGTGSDTCQSIRHPSSVNGLVGIRPSLGVISQHGIFPLSHSRDTGGPMTRTVRDAALMLGAMAGVDPRDRKTLDFPATARPSDYTQFLDRSRYGVAGRHLGLVRQIGSNTSPWGTGAQAELIEAAAAKLAEMGAHIHEVYLPDFANVGAGSRHFDMNDYFKVFEAEGGHSPRHCVSSLFATEANGRGACTGVDGILETLRVGARTAALFALVAADDPDRAPSVAQREYVTRRMDALVDADGLPVLDADGHQVRLDALLLSPGPTGGRTCDFGSTTQMGSIVVPVGFDDSVGVPRGMEIFVRRFDEGTGLGIAYDYEQATQHRRPPDIVPSPLASPESIASFNAAAQQALMTAGSAAPEDLPLETYIQALRDLTGL